MACNSSRLLMQTRWQCKQHKDSHRRVCQKLLLRGPQRVQQCCKGIIGRNQEGGCDVRRVHLICNEEQCFSYVVGICTESCHSLADVQTFLAHCSAALEAEQQQRITTLRRQPVCHGTGTWCIPAKPTVWRASAQKLSSAVLLKVSQGVRHPGVSATLLSEALDALPISCCCNARPRFMSCPLLARAPTGTLRSQLWRSVDILPEFVVSKAPAPLPVSCCCRTELQPFCCGRLHSRGPW